MLRRILREPLVHFLALGALIFVAYAALHRTDREDVDAIVIGSAKLAQLAAIFTRTWQRPPTPAELKSLVDDAVKDELYVREATALGLDRDDEAIRRRLRAKVQYLYEAEVEAMPVDDAALQAFLSAHPDRFTTEPVYAFRQIVLRPDARGDHIDRDAAVALAALRSGDTPDPSTMGDPMMLPAVVPPVPGGAVEQMFGPDFAAALAAAPVGEWGPPIASPYGLHLVFLTEKTPGRLPALAEVRPAVQREWRGETRNALERQRLDALLARYKVVVEPLAPAKQGTAP
jgi:hypothetical protein